jgi:superfamily II DNA/RNA helicase
MAETPKDFAQHLLLRSHPALCTPSGFYSPGRSSYPSRPYFCVSLEEFFFSTKIHPRSWKKKRLAIEVPLDDPENERHRSSLFLSGPDSKCGQKMKEKKQKKNLRDSTRCCDDRKTQTKKEKTSRSDLQRESAWLPDEERAANLGTLRRLANTVRDEDEDDDPRGWRTWMRNTNNTGIVCILS